MKRLSIEIDLERLSRILWKSLLMTVIVFAIWLMCVGGYFFWKYEIRPIISNEKNRSIFEHRFAEATIEQTEIFCKNQFGYELVMQDEEAFACNEPSGPGNIFISTVQEQLTIFEEWKAKCNSIGKDFYYLYEDESFVYAYCLNDRPWFSWVFVNHTFGDTYFPGVNNRSDLVP